MDGGKVGGSALFENYKRFSFASQTTPPGRAWRRGSEKYKRTVVWTAVITQTGIADLATSTSKGRCTVLGEAEGTALIGSCSPLTSRSDQYRIFAQEQQLAITIRTPPRKVDFCRSPFHFNS